MKIIQFKSTVRIKRWTPAIAKIIDSLNILQNKYTWLPELVITSANDSTHSENSRHYKDEALDVRSKNFNTLIDKLLFKSALSEELGAKFVVLLEDIDKPNEHFHIQVKKGSTYP